ncbi:hypothetical protein ALC57_17354 [Trachymyrmex cornetzi]|uniref:Uncharacterized protein n=1 Tax=Trachymyrmex cornetzi TaxID=471704 RepID=A0A195DD40_9HYME|nr:hypothetical protein ALC57_17354 [Trachymyrmex cornetzi]
MASELGTSSPLTSQINYNYCETGLHCTAKHILVQYDALVAIELLYRDICFKSMDKCYKQLGSYLLLGFISKENAAKREIFDRYSVGIEVRVTNEIPVVSTESNAVRDVVPPWTTTSAPSRTSPTTPTNPHSQFLSPNVFHGRNSLCSANEMIQTFTLRKKTQYMKHQLYSFIRCPPIKHNCIIGLSEIPEVQSTIQQSCLIFAEKNKLCYMYCLHAIRIYHRDPFNATRSNPFKSMFSSQTPVFLAAQCCFPGGWRITHYTRRRRPMTLRIGPRLSLPSKSTSAPTTTTDGEWRALRGAFILHVKLLTNSVHSKSWLSIDAFITVRIIHNQVKRSGVDCDKGFLRAASFAQSSIGDRASTGIHAMMMKCDEKKREMFSRRACSESGPHPGIPGYGNVPVGGHLWGKRNQGRTSAPIVGHARPPAIILRTRRSWPVAPTHCRRANAPDILRHIFGKVGLTIPILIISLFTDPNRAFVGKFLSEKRIFQLKSRVIQPNNAGLDYIDGSLLKISLHTSKSIFVKIGLHLSIALVSPASFSSYSTRNVISGCNCRVL